MDIPSIVKNILIRNFRRIKQLLIRDESIKASKAKWDNLSKENAEYYIMSNYGKDITEEQFRESGKKDYQELIADDKILQSLGDYKNLEILEIGCGIGRITQFIGRNFKKVLGIDISHEMILQGRKYVRKNLPKNDHVTMISGDGEHYKALDNSFDVVFSFITFQHMPSRKVVRKNLSEVARVLKKGGIAKIQLRGERTAKGEWYYGPHFTPKQVEEMLSDLPVELIKLTGAGKRYMWVWFKKA